ALAARERAVERGVRAAVVNVSSIRPVDADGLARRAAAAGRVITVEEHSVHGGLGSLVAETLAERGVAVPLVRLGFPEGQFVKAGPRAAIRAHYRIDADGILVALLRITGRGSSSP
ncbi:MAG TPA: transketolase C-terminal domain-containing protein, partial [bacterium]|nr:transketolase C-terminal domain-containing protein [bacterium]